MPQVAFAAGLPAIVLGQSGAPLPQDFAAFPPFKTHATIAVLITAFLAVHVVAAEAIGQVGESL